MQNSYHFPSICAWHTQILLHISIVGETVWKLLDHDELLSKGQFILFLISIFVSTHQVIDWVILNHDRWGMYIIHIKGQNTAGRLTAKYVPGRLVYCCTRRRNNTDVLFTIATQTKYLMENSTLSLVKGAVGSSSLEQTNSGRVAAPYVMNARL